MATSTIKSSGGDYTSLSAWEADKQGDLTGLGPEIAECYDVDDTTPCTIAGWTTTSSDYIEIRAATAARCNGSTRAQTGNTYRLSGSDTAGQLRIAEEFVRVYGIEIKSTGAQPAVEIPSSTITAPSDIRIENCVLITSDVSASTDYIFRASESGTNLTLRNTILVGNRRGIDTRYSDTAIIDHCIFYTTNASLGLVCDSEATVTNTVAMGYTSQCFWTGGAASSGSHNAASDTSVTTDYTNSLASLVAANEFTNPSVSDATLDFALKSGSNLIDAGTGSVTTDISGATRSPPVDIGAFEFVSSGPTYSLTPETGTFSVTGGVLSLLHNRSISPATGSLTTTGGNVSLLYNRVITPETGSLSVTGDSINVLYNRQLTPGTGSFSLTGDPITLTYTPSGATYTLTPETGLFAVTGGAVSLLHNKNLIPATGTLSLTGDAINVLYNRVLVPSTGSFVLSGSAINLYANRQITLGTGALNVTGSSITLTYSSAVVPDTPESRTLSINAYARTLNANTRIRIVVADEQNRNL